MRRTITVTVVSLVALLAVGVAPALGLVPALSVETFRTPSTLPLGGEAKLTLETVNLGDAPAVGASSPIVITDTLPSGLTATSVAGPECAILSPQLVRCESLETIVPDHFMGTSFEVRDVEIQVAVAAGAPATVVNETSVSGGGATQTVAREALPVSSTPAGFVIEKLRLTANNEDGSLDAQAGSHPFQLTSTIRLNKLAPKDIQFELPAGLLGNPNVVPKCTRQQLETVFPFENDYNACPADTAIGVAEPFFEEPRESSFVVPVFNMVPGVGEAARFAFSIAGIPTILRASVPAGGKYGVIVSASDVSQDSGPVGARVTFWGVPGDPRHDAERGWQCLGLELGEEVHRPCVLQGGLSQKPFLTLPTSCEGLSGMRVRALADSWFNQGVFTEAEATQENGAGEPVGLSGCDGLRFDPSLSVAPDGQQADSPSGLTAVEHVSQEGSLNPTGLASANVRDITVALPAGMSVNPSGADGLEACSEAEIGFLAGESEPPGKLRFTSGLPEPFCPDASKIGTVKVTTPLLPNPLEGAIYLASQNANPFGSLIAMYLVAEDPVSGTLVKLPGEVSLDQETGRVTASFKNLPDLPFEDAELHFFGGARAPLATPSHCGTFTTTSSFAPWSGNPAATPSSSFEITSGPNGGPCPGASLPFTPSLTAGSPNINAGAFSPLTTTITRDDGNQDIQSVQLHLAPGMLGIITGVPLCGETQANAGTCPAASQIGETIVSVGLGGDPYTVTGGKVYLTEKYKGAPFGLSIVNPAKAGPFDLGQVIVRAKIEVDPKSAQLTVTTDSSGPYAIPHILDGIPLQIKHVNVTINRPGFTFNPTSCDPMSITGTVGSVESANSSVSVPFQVTNCANLKFAPKFSAAISAKTSKANGASFKVRVTYPSGVQGTEANVRSVKVELPRALPSRLSTLQQACPAATFEANPASCPAASVVGHAIVHTHVLPVPLEGPAYFVSHGGEEFPSLVMVLQGDGVTIQLVGATFIKNGITSSTFATVPDVLFESFELTLPQGKYSALAATGDVCHESLVMPTALNAQNGATLNQDTHIEVEGCPNALSVSSKHLAGDTLTLKIAVPGAGRLTASGRGLRTGSRSSNGRETVVLKLRVHLTAAQRTALKRHAGRKIVTTLKLRFIPKSGKGLATALSVKL